MTKKNPIEEKLAKTQAKMSERLKAKKENKSYKPVKEQYAEIKESMKPKVKEIVNEQELINELFNFQEEAIEILPEQEETKHRDGLWDFVLEDEITFFDPLCSYELTGYKPINDKDGLDFDPTPFREAAILYETTGQYSAYSKDSKPYIDFWEEQKRRCREGYEVNGYRIPGDFYFFLNFYRLPVAKEENGRSFVEENFPVFTTEHYKWFHYVELCELLQRDVCALKSRGVGWSEIAASLSVRPFITERNYTSIYTAFNSTFLDGVLDKCWYQLNWLNHHTNYGMYRARGKYDNAYHKRASKVDKEGNEYGRFSNIIGIVADNPRKIRGERCARLFYEESGSQPHLSTGWVQGEALITRGGRRVGSRFAWGTGGDSDPKALDGLSKMFNNPDAYNILPYKHNFTEDGETVLTAFFLPAYAMVIDPKYMDNRGYTDMVKAREYFESERKKKSGQVLLDYCAEYCFTGSEALLKQGDSIFDTIAIADRLTQLRVQKIGVKPQVVDLQWDCPNADMNPRNKVKMIPNQFGKVKIYEPPIRDDDGNPYKNLYIAGIDSIDQGTGDSSTQSDVSDFCIVIKKRVHGSSMPNYVAIYKDRPKDIVTAYENAMKLLVMYNCKAMLEHTKISIIMHFRSKKMDKLLMQRPKSTLSDIRKGNSTMIGYPATETYLKHGLDLINTFVNESCYSIQIDEMLEQLLKYSWENKRKFDIIAAMIAAELGDEDLMGFTPKVSNAITNEWRDFGWYVDAYGNKRYGIIPK